MMNSRLSFIFFILYGSMAFANLPFEYKSTGESPSVFELASWRQKFQAMNYLPLNQSDTGELPGLHVDQIFEAPVSGAVFLKLGWAPNISTAENKIHRHPNGYLWMGRTEVNTHISLFFYQMPLKQVHSVLRRLGLMNTNIHFPNFFLEHAQADTPELCPTFTQTASLSELSNITESFALDKVLKSCAISAIKGTVDDAVDFAKGSWKALKNLFTNPEALWKDVVEKYEKVKDLVLNIKPKIQDFISSLGNLDTETAAELACTTVAQITIQALLPGAGIAKIGLLLAEKLQTLAKLKKALTLLSKLRSKNPFANRLTHEILACTK